MESSLDLLLVGAFESFDSSRLRFLAPQLGIERLAGYVRKKGHSAKTIDPNIDPIEMFYKTVSEKKPRVIGFSVSFVTLLNDLALIHYAKKHCPDSLILAGGQQATFDYIELFKIAPIDLIVLGEGEIPLLEILNKFKNGEDVHQVKGIVYKQKDKIYRNGNNEPLNYEQFKEVTLGIDFKQIDYRKYWNSIERFYDEPNYPETRTIRLFSLNYCPFHCTYCSSRSFQNAAKGSVDENYNPRGEVTRVTGLNGKDLVQLIENAISAYPEVHRFFIQDDEHLLNKSRIKEFCKIIIEKKSKGEIPNYIQFMCQSRVNDVNQEILNLMGKAGYKLIGYGVETFSERMLDSVKKFNKPEHVHNAIKWTLEAGIIPFMNLIIMLPEISREDIFITFDSALEYIRQGVEVATEPLVMPLPGSVLYYSKEYKQHVEKIKIPGTDQYIERRHFVIPRDPEMAELAFKLFEASDTYLKAIAEKYKFGHLPTRLRSLVTFYAVFDILGVEDRKRQIESLFEQLSIKSTAKSYYDGYQKQKKTDAQLEKLEASHANT